MNIMNSFIFYSNGLFGALLPILVVSTLLLATKNFVEAFQTQWSSLNNSPFSRPRLPVIAKRNTFAPLNHSEITTKLTATGTRQSTDFDYDLIIVGCGVGGHGAALHAASKKLKTLVLAGGDAGGTCVNRGCVPSKALLAASGRVREIKNRNHLKALGISVGDVEFDREKIAAHADQLVAKVKGGLVNSLKGLGVEVRNETGKLTDANTVELLDGTKSIGKLKAMNIILAPGSIPFIPPGIEVDEKTVFTSDGGVKLPGLPPWLAIVGSGYIGLEFADIFTALGSEVTFIEAADRLMPTFEPEIAKLANRLLIQPRKIDSRVGVFAAEVKCGEPGKKPVIINLIDAKTKEKRETLEVDACMVATGRIPNTKNLGLDALNVNLAKGGFVPVDKTMRVVDQNGNSIPTVFCIGDANGKLMLAHAASAQGTAAVESMTGNLSYHVNHETIPAACFTHPEIAFVGLTEAQARQRGKEQGFEVQKVTSSFRANSKALAEGEGDGAAILLIRKDTGTLLGVHIIGMHASDLIQEAANAMTAGTPVKDLSFMVHAHPTLSEVMDAAFKQAMGVAAH